MAIVLVHAALIESGSGPALDQAGQESLQAILSAANRARKQTRQLLDFSRRSPIAPQLVELGQMLRNLRHAIRSLPPAHTARRLDVRPDLPAVVEVDATVVEQAVINLVIHPVDAMPSAGLLQIRLQPRGPQNDASHGIVVSDTGIGMTRRTRERASELFFTTKGPRRGTGLGLAMVHGVTRHHDDTVHLESAAGAGTTIRLCSPVAASDELASSHAEEPRTGPSTTGATYERTALVVDDEPMVRRAIRRVLQQAGGTVHVACDGLAALEIYRRHSSSIDTILTDSRMPALSGPALIERLRESGDPVAVLLTSGCSGEPRVIRGLPGLRIFAKPCRPDVLVRALPDLFDEARAEPASEDQA